MEFKIHHPRRDENDNDLINLWWEHPEFGLIPFSCSSTDSTPWGKELFNLLKDTV